MTIIAFQIDEFGTTGRTSGGELLRSLTIPSFSFDYDVLTYTQNERSRFWQLERHKLTEEQEAEVERHISGIVVDTELTKRMAQNHQARKILAQTDWYVVRKMETGKEIPDQIIAMRMQARSNVVND